MRLYRILFLTCFLCGPAFAEGNPKVEYFVQSNNTDTPIAIAYSLPEAWRIEIAPNKDVLVFYPDASLFLVQSSTISRWTPSVARFLEAWQGSFLNSQQLLATNLRSNFTYLPTATWPSAFVESDFPDTTKLPLPDSVADMPLKEYKTVTILSPWFKMRLFVTGHDLTGIQVYHNLTKLLSWQDDFFFYNLEHNIIPHSQLDVNFGSDRFFNSFPSQYFSRDALALVARAYQDDFLHQSRELSNENLMDSFKEKAGYDLELMSYAFLLPVIKPKHIAINEAIAALPSNCGNSYILYKLIYQSLFNEIQQRLKNHPSSSTIVITRKEVYSRIEEEYLQNPSQVEAISKHSCFDKTTYEVKERRDASYTE